MKRSVVLIALLLCGCTDPEGARKTLQHAGIKPTHVGGYSILGCSDDDEYATEFEGIGQDSQPVSGVVCRGMFFKASTIRFD